MVFISRCFALMFVVVLLAESMLFGQEPVPTPAVALERLKEGNGGGCRRQTNRAVRWRGVFDEGNVRG